MKKTFTILAAAAALTASAALPANTWLKSDPRFNSTATKTELPRKCKKAAQKAPKALAPVKKADTPQAVPAGERRMYNVSSTCQYIYWGWWLMPGYATYTAEYIFGDNGDVYTNAMIFDRNGYYVKGSLEGDKITYQFPQDYYYEEFYDYDLEEQVSETYPLMVLDYEKVDYTDEETGEEYFELMMTVAEDQTFEFAYDPETKAMKAITDKAIGLVYYDEEEEDYVVIGIADLGYDMTWLENVSFVDVPENLDYKDYIFRAFDVQYYEDAEAFVKVAEDGDYLYIKGMSQMAPELLVRAEKKDGGWWIPNAQYLGSAYGVNIFSFSSLLSEDEDEEISYEPIDGYMLVFDEETGVLCCEEGDASFSFNADVETLYAVDLYMNITLERHDAPAAAEPEPAMALYFDDSMWDDGYGNSVTFYAYPYSVDGELLPADRLYYMLLTDDMAYTFEADDFEYLTEDLTMVPYNYNDGWDFGADGAWHQCFFFVTGMDSVSIVMMYLNDDGTYTPSEPATLVLSETGVSAISDNSDAVYYDLSGRRVMNPGKGIYIVRTADKTRKAIIK